MTDRPRLLLIDDTEAYTEAIQRHLSEYDLVEVKPNQFRAEDGFEAVEFLRAHQAGIDLILLDMRFDLPADRLFELEEANSLRRQQRYQGVAILRVLRAQFPQLPILILTSVDDLSFAALGSTLEGLSLTYMLQDEGIDALRIRIHYALGDAEDSGEEGVILWGHDARLKGLRRRLSILARGALPVVLEGETGTGKSFLAEHFLHPASQRSGPFITLDLATMPSDLISAHLFGAVRGAYTGAVDRKGVFEMADGGTLFIDEIQNIPLEVQKQLLLVLQDQRVRPLGSNREVRVDVKVIAATNTSLVDAVRQGSFRADLYMRLSPATKVRMPNLRDRAGDIPFMIKRMVSRAGEAPDIAPFRERLAQHMPSLRRDAPLIIRLPDDPRKTKDALELSMPGPAWRRLLRYRWPGNVRELSMVVHNIVAFTLVTAVDAVESGLELRTNHLQIDAGLVNELLASMTEVATDGVESTQDPDTFTVRIAPDRSLNSVSAAVERQYLTALFHQTQGNLESMADRLLGDPERSRAVRLRMNQLGLRLRKLRKE